jgi:hypothetical protein
VTVISLGDQYLTGVFLKSTDVCPSHGPIDVFFCKNCGLLQLKQSYSLDEMYGENYGYRSGLNISMVRHLQQKISNLEEFIKPTDTDLVIDIGSNDATSLKAYKSNCIKVGIDPTGTKFKGFYTDNIHLIPDFFDAGRFLDQFKWKKAKIITSIAMFYDLEDPSIFVKDIEKCLDDEGVWHFEQSYMPLMLQTNAYDTICHEHLEFYSLNVVMNLLEKNNMRIVDVVTNNINGGSFAITACKKNASYGSNFSAVCNLLDLERKMKINELKTYEDFGNRMVRHRESLLNLINSILKKGQRIIGYGASTKGNVLLQFCGLSVEQIPYIAEVNPDKFGSFTPGTNIPIISEEEAKAMDPDYFFVLPWHFKNNILERERKFRENGGKFIFPLPEIEIV